MVQLKLAVPLFVALALASAPAQARTRNQSLLAPQPGRELGAGWLLAQAERYDVIRTKDGRVHIGKILRETAKGYLFSEGDGSTVVIEFEQVANISNTADAAAPPPPPQPVHPAQPVPPPQQLAPPPPGPSPVDTARIYELMRERGELEADSPSIGGPIATLIVGAVLIPIGYLVAFGISTAGTVGLALLITGAVVIVIGAILVLVGAIRLPVNIIRRIARTARMNSIDDELERLRRGGVPEARAPLDGPSPQWLVAQF